MITDLFSFRKEFLRELTFANGLFEILFGNKLVRMVYFKSFRGNNLSRILAKADVHLSNFLPLCNIFIR